MSDETDDDQTNTLPAPPPDAAFAAFENLLQLVADPKAFKSRLRGLHQALAAVSEGQAKLAADRAEFAQEAAKERAEIATERAALEKRRVAVHQDEGAIAEAGKHMAKLIEAWKFIGEDNPLVRSGLMEAQYAPLEKAQRAFAPYAARASHGDDDDPPADGRELRREVDGVPFAAGTSITREIAVPARAGRSQRVQVDQ